MPWGMPRRAAPELHGRLRALPRRQARWAAVNPQVVDADLHPAGWQHDGLGIPRCPGTPPTDSRPAGVAGLGSDSGWK